MRPARRRVRADVHLVDDEVLEMGRDEASVVPGEIRPPQNAFAGAPFELARIGVALPAAAGVTDHPELVSLAIARAPYEAPPIAAGVLQASTGRGVPPCEVAQHVHFVCVRRPYAECCPLRHQGGAHGRVRPEVFLRDGAHVSRGRRTQIAAPGC